MFLVQKFSDNSISSIIILQSGVVMMKNYFKGRHFQKDIILVSVNYYFRFSLSYRVIVEVLRDRGITPLHHTTIMRWVHHYVPLFKLLWRKQRCSHSQSWRVDELYQIIERRDAAIRQDEEKASLIDILKTQVGQSLQVNGDVDNLPESIVQKISENSDKSPL